MDQQLFDAVSFGTAKASGITVTSEASGSPDTIVTMTTANLPAGTYFVAYSFEVLFGSKNQPAWFKLAGTFPDSDYFSISSADTDELNRNRMYGYPKVWGGGPVTLTLQMYKSAATTLTANFADVMLHRVG